MASTIKVFKNVKIIWKNFSGKVGPYDPQVGVDSQGKPIAKRHFSIILTEEMAEELRKIELRTKSGQVVKGCNVKTRLPKDGEGEPLYTLKVAFGNYPPEAIWRVIPRGRMALDLETVGNLDHEFIDHADIKVSFATYEMGPNVGITAYLSKLIAYVQEDELDTDDAFANIPIIGGSDSPMPINNDDEDLPF